jgi:hypothetical protein
MDVFFNELSIKPFFISKEQIYIEIEKLLKAFKSLKDSGFSHIRFDQEFHKIILMENYSLQRWISEGSYDNLKTLLLGVSRRPFIDESRSDLMFRFSSAIVKVSQEDEVLESTTGFLGAYLAGSLTLSFSHNLFWARDHVEIQVFENSVFFATESVINIYSEDQKERLDIEPIKRSYIKREATDIDIFIEKIKEYFPGLIFCENAKTQLSRISTGDMRFNNLLNKLIRLDLHASRWKIGQFDFKTMGIDCSPDTQQRINQTIQKRTFVCPDGETRIFSLHCKWSIGSDEVRLYFFPEPIKRKLFIGYIGNKSGIGY